MLDSFHTLIFSFWTGRTIKAQTEKQTLKEDTNTQWLMEIMGCGMKKLEKKASNDVDLYL
jgi:hypothetical protein